MCWSKKKMLQEVPNNTKMSPYDLQEALPTINMNVYLKKLTVKVYI